MDAETCVNINCASAEVSGQYFGKLVVYKHQPVHLLSVLVSFISLKVRFPR